MIPVVVLTGFLGSGKTTLLARLLRHAAFARTAVIINEFGEVGLDHDLVETSEESFLTLETGCVCCAVRGDLVLTLEGLLARRDGGAVPPFERVVIETSGLADPAPILHAVMTDGGLARRLRLAGVVATVDAVNGIATLARQPESLKQAVVADRLLLTKTDLVGGGEVEALVRRLSALNPEAAVLTASFGEVAPERLLDMEEVAARGVSPEAPRHVHEHAGHADDICCFAVLREAPIRAVTLTLLLEVLAEHCGPDLLRLKGIVNIAESPARPAVIHGVQHVFHPPAWLERWPSADRRSRLVFIGRNLRQAWVEALLDALEAEVGEVTGR